MYRFSAKIFQVAVGILLCFHLTVLQAISPRSEDCAFGSCVPKYLAPPDPWQNELLKHLIEEEPNRHRERVERRAADASYQNQLEEREKALATFLEGITSPYEPGNEPFAIQIKKGEKDKLPEQERGKVNTEKKVNVKPLEETEGALSDIVLQDEAEIRRLFGVFRDEAFGSCAEESGVLWSNSARMMMLLNRYKSISSTLNRTLKRYSPHVLSDPTLLVERIFWEPKWVTRKGKEVPLKVVRLYFLKYLEINKEGALSFLKKQEFDGLKANLNAFVPYRDLREVIRISEQRKEWVRSAFAGRPYVYEAIHDGDIMGLRGTRGKGLYSHYIELISGNGEQIPHILSTGYQAYYDPQQFQSVGYTKTEYYHLMRTIEEDRYGREALAKINFNLIYISEPNFLVRISGKEGGMPYSFMGRAFLGYHNRYEEGPAESGMILAELKESIPNYIGVFDASHPVLMRLPNRMLFHKQSGTNIKSVCKSSPFSKETDLFSRASKKVRKLVENIAQTVFSFRDVAITVYRQLSLKGLRHTYEGTRVNRPNTFFTSLLTQILNAYDPLKMMEKANELRKDLSVKESAVLKQNGSFHFILSHYKKLAARFKFLLNEKVKGDNEKVEGAIKKLNALTTKSGQIAALRRLVDKIFGTGIFDILHDGAKALGEMRVNLLQRYFVTSSPQGVASSPQGVASSPQGVASSPQGVASSPQGDSPLKVKELSEQKARRKELERETQDIVRKLELDHLAEPAPAPLSLVIKSENKETPIKLEPKALKAFSPEEVMAYLKGREALTVTKLNSLAGYSGNASRNIARLSTTLDEGRWNILLRNLETQYPTISVALRGEFAVPN